MSERKKILVVDDNIADSNHVANQVEQLGSVAVQASSATRALELLRQGNHFDLTILHDKLLDMNAVDLAHEIRALPDNANMPLMLFSSDIPPKNNTGDPFVSQLQKPVSSQRLCGVLCMCFDGKPHSVVDESTKQESFDTLRVLLAEDNPIGQKVAMRLLAKIGCHADVVANGLEAVDAWRNIHYDVILMDCQMPELDGYDATRRIREEESQQGRRPYIIAMTANAMQGDRKLCLDAGMDDYLSKPVRIHELQEALTQYLHVRASPAVVENS